MSVPSTLLRVPVDMPNRNGANLSHSNSFTGMTGTLIPVLCEELLPNDTVSLGSQLQVQLPPMVTDFYGRVDFVLEAFFCPNRLCWGGWSDFITHPTAGPQYPEGTPVQAKPNVVPSFFVESTTGIQSNTLLHYLDYGRNIVNGKQSVLPSIAYHRIWDDWYRDSRVQSPLFYRTVDLTYQSNMLAGIPYLSTKNNGTVLAFSPDTVFTDNVSVSSLRQRNWVKDYFTSASPLPQAGNASEVKFDVNVATETGAFSIATLRTANSLQIWMERNNLAGYRYADQIYAQFGVYPADAIMDRPLYLGRNVTTVYNKSVYQTAPGTSSGADGVSGSLGSKSANSMGLGEGSIVDKFTATEHGFLMVLASLVPRPVYGFGTERMTQRLRVGDFAFPLLAGMGDQAITNKELTGDNTHDEVFGYTDLYAEYKFRNDKIHGKLSDDETLQKFAIQRSFTSGSNKISNSFLQIPTDYLDQVQVNSTSLLGFSYWAEIYFPFRKISTLPAYSQPTLEDLQYAHKEYISRGGKRL